MKHILVVDDDADLGRMLERTLRKHGLDAIVANGGQSARNIIALRRIDGILLDVVLGTENGWELLRQLRGFCDVPIIMMTGAGVDNAVRVDAAELGAQGVLQKPFDEAELLECLRALIEKQ